MAVKSSTRGGETETVPFTGLGHCMKVEEDSFSGLGHFKRGGGLFSFSGLGHVKKAGVELLAEVDLGGFLYTSGQEGVVGKGQGRVNGHLGGEEAGCSL